MGLQAGAGNQGGAHKHQTARRLYGGVCSRRRALSVRRERAAEEDDDVDLRPAPGAAVVSLLMCGLGLAVGLCLGTRLPQVGKLATPISI
jgi:hypothetical protein